MAYALLIVIVAVLLAVFVHPLLILVALLALLLFA